MFLAEFAFDHISKFLFKAQFSSGRASFESLWVKTLPALCCFLEQDAVTFNCTG